MDNSTHTVTMPISDYNEIVGEDARLRKISKSILDHFNLLKRKGILMVEDFDKNPIDVVVQKIDADPMPKIYFKYE